MGREKRVSQEKAKWERGSPGQTQKRTALHLSAGHKALWDCTLVAFLSLETTTGKFWELT